MAGIQNFFSFFKSLQANRTPDQVVVLSLNILEEFGGPAYLDDLLSAGLGSHGNQFLLRAGNQKIYQMWVFIVDDACSWTLEDASAHLSSYLQRGRESATTVLFSVHNVSDVSKEATQTYLTTVRVMDSKTCQSLMLPKEEQDLYHDFGDADPSSSRPKRAFFRTLAIILYTMVLV
ncbi:hypothetical protein E2P81_ATG00642 [Venturia nashicola]|nr:hypothetical protein E2P81_ATG00642 [Venturia nashicola]